MAAFTPEQQQVNDHLRECLRRFCACTSNAPRLARFQEALSYVLENGGKRIRPILVYAIGKAFDLPPSHLDAAACAIELIHSYSLVHDDLPAMDDDELRRGKPTCHRVFDEATAILVGDALQTLAFECLSDPDMNPISAEQRLRQIQILARAAGPQGMIAGQALDMAAEGHQLSLAELRDIHSRKTGALIQACADLAIAAAACTDPILIQKLQTFTQTMGLAFQVKDDLLDVIGDTQTLGKTAGSDQRNDKMTFPRLLGIPETEALLAKLLQDANMAIAEPAIFQTHLGPLAEFFVARTY